MKRAFGARTVFCALSWLGLCLSATRAEAQDNAGLAPGRTSEPRAVIELFTSQGCSSCPPADQTIGELSRDPTLIPMSVPIDYWDYLGWKDTLASPRHSARQRGYAARRGDREVYTPQAVVNGVAQALGSDRSAIESAIALSHTRPNTLTLPVKVVSKGAQIEISVFPRDESGGEGEVWVCALTRIIPVAIKRGENRGRTVTYYNVVRRWVRLGKWAGAEQTWTVAKSEIASEGVNAVAVLIQAGNVENPGPIFGAAIAPME